MLTDNNYRCKTRFLGAINTINTSAMEWTLLLRELQIALELPHRNSWSTQVPRWISLASSRDCQTRAVLHVDTLPQIG